MSRRAPEVSETALPSEPEDSLVQALIERLNQGDVQAREELFRAFAAELHDMAQAEMKRQPRAHTLQATALVSEVYLRLFGHTPAAFAGKRHFLRAAGQAMRHVLTDHARAKLRLKRGGAAQQEAFDPELADPTASQAQAFLEFSDAIEVLAEADPESARAMEMTHFLGATQEEVSEALGIPVRTLQRRLDAASALLASRLS
jgi:RNA polymerase sigma factor (TIGR02999 family)